MLDFRGVVDADSERCGTDRLIHHKHAIGRFQMGQLFSSLESLQIKKKQA